MTLSAPSSDEPRSPASGPWSEQDIRDLIHMWRDHDPAEIAQKLGRKANAVSIKASRLGLPPRASINERSKTARSNPKARVRPCLSCQIPFFSEGPHNRICDKCKNTAVWRSDSAGFRLSEQGSLR